MLKPGAFKLWCAHWIRSLRRAHPTEGVEAEVTGEGAVQVRGGDGGVLDPVRRGGGWGWGVSFGKFFFDEVLQKYLM